MHFPRCSASITARMCLHCPRLYHYLNKEGFHENVITYEELGVRNEHRKGKRWTRAVWRHCMRPREVARKDRICGSRSGHLILMMTPWNNELDSCGNEFCMLAEQGPGHNTHRSHDQQDPRPREAGYRRRRRGAFRESRQLRTRM